MIQRLDKGEVMNHRQKLVFIAIKSLIQNQEYSEDDLRDSIIRYNILNLIARFSLANDTYLQTEIAKAHLVENTFMKDGQMTRSRKSQKNGFTYEHPVPCSVTCDLIMKDRFNDDAIKEILIKTNIVTILTAAENNLLNQHNLQSKMPKNWCFETDNMFARYEVAGVEIPIKVVRMSGTINR